ncbi:MAG: hypothetical protein IH830_00315 [Planctomycetes bacterium]|nr:hypothetical protein [Planctomycetota bacterium]
MPDNGPPAEEKAPPTEIAFHYEKGNYFRVIHVDGGHGGLSPDGQSLVLSVYTERRPIPKKEVFDLDENGALIQPPKDKDERTGIFREVEATLIMNPTTASAIRIWLTKYLDQQKEASVEIEKTKARIRKAKEETE